LSTNEALLPGCFYHVYNRGNNRENLFLEERNFLYFLQLYSHYIAPIAETFAYCLMPNHFHFLIRIRSLIDEGIMLWDKVSSISKPISPSRCFSNLFNAYTKTINEGYDRTGSLFQKPFHRNLVDSDAYFTNLVFYIHFNPQKHGFVDDFREWRWSSYSAYCSNSVTCISRDIVLDWFGGIRQFQEFHQGNVDEYKVNRLIYQDD
jgi:putative transposase